MASCGLAVASVFAFGYRGDICRVRILRSEGHLQLQEVQPFACMRAWQRYLRILQLRRFRACIEGGDAREVEEVLPLPARPPSCCLRRVTSKEPAQMQAEAMIPVAPDIGRSVKAVPRAKACKATNNASARDRWLRETGQVS